MPKSLRKLGEALGTQGGRITLLIALILSGMIGDRVGVPWAEHVTVAGLAVILVEINKPDFPSQGLRIATLLLLLVFSAVGTELKIRCAEQIFLSTFAVLLVIIRDEPPPQTYLNQRRLSLGYPCGLKAKERCRWMRLYRELAKVAELSSHHNRESASRRADRPPSRVAPGQIILGGPSSKDVKDASI